MIWPEHFSNNFVMKKKCLFRPVKLTKHAIKNEFIYNGLLALMELLSVKAAIVLANLKRD